jgi:hypothetical protein
VPPGFGPATLEPGPIAEFNGPAQCRRVVAAVVNQTQRIAIRHRLGHYQVAPAQFEPVEAMPAAGDVDQPFEHEHDLRPPGAAIGRSRGGVGDDTDAAHVRGRDTIDARRHRDAFGQWHKGNRTGPKIAGVDPAQGQEVAVPVQRELGFRHQVAAVKVGQKGLAALAHPLHRPPDSLRRPGDQHKLRASVVADPEIPADIARDHPHRVFRHGECSGDVVAVPGHAAAGTGVHGELRPRLIVSADRRTQLHRHAGDAIDRGVQPDDMRRTREKRLGRRLVARLGVDAQI